MGTPSVILYDEPTAGLDPIMSNTITELIRDVQQNLGVTSILVTHDLTCAFEAGDTIALVENGRVIHQDRADDFASTDHPVVRNFLKGGRIPAQEDSPTSLRNM